MGCSIDISLLGANFSIRADKDEVYVKRILSFLDNKIEETKKRIPTADPIKISILTSFYLIDELLKEKDRGTGSALLSTEADEIDAISTRLIAEIESLLPLERPINSK